MKCVLVVCNNTLEQLGIRGSTQFFKGWSIVRAVVSAFAPSQERLQPISFFGCAEAVPGTGTIGQLGQDNCLKDGMECQRWHTVTS